MMPTGDRMKTCLIAALMIATGAMFVWLQIWLKTGYLFPPKR